jgi:hypothetical protein
MKLPLVVLLATMGCAPSAALIAAETDATRIEQQLFDDVAARMQQQLHGSADLLNKIRQSHDAKERDNLVIEYHKSMKTTMTIDRLMRQIQEAAIESDRATGRR